ncbi:NAD-dependent epimerase/dehydratase family protein [Parapusillimonas sp. SGNA-6]|nr:NAD-dependent epimerase/dehydratase family protein [Parapusillimonas sp. SGNA-6]
MIIGNGLVASAFATYSFSTDPNITVFASGVSNSTETREEAFLREKALLLKTLENNKLIYYFSSCSIEDPQLRTTPYAVHKVAMESLVRSAKNYRIFRLPQVVGKTSNPTTLTNFLYQHIRSGTRFHVWKSATRNIIDIDHVASIVHHLHKCLEANNTTLNIAAPYSTPVLKLVTTFEAILNTEAHYDVIEAGGSYSIEAATALRAAKELNIDFENKYIERLLRKYYCERYNL